MTDNQPDNDGRPQPPLVVYKYVVDERIDVLENGKIRFTPPLNTNDIFEVRQTFELFAGPKMEALFEETLEHSDVNELIDQEISKLPFPGISPGMIKEIFKQQTGVDIETMVRDMTAKAVANNVLPTMNSGEAIDKLLTDLGSNLICLSLSESMNSPPMWAHYAGNATGFAIALKTDNPSFHRGENLERQGLHQIQYFDGRIGEVMEDPYAAFISKQADWSYEKEWRLYLKSDEASDILEVGSEQIHLVEFPSDAIHRVILGPRASESLETEIKNIISTRYPDATVTRTQADRSAAKLIEYPV